METQTAAIRYAQLFDTIEKWDFALELVRKYSPICKEFHKIFVNKLINQVRFLENGNKLQIIPGYSGENFYINLVPNYLKIGNSLIPRLIPFSDFLLDNYGGKIKVPFSFSDVIMGSYPDIINAYGFFAAFSVDDGNRLISSPIQLTINDNDFILPANSHDAAIYFKLYADEIIPQLIPQISRFLNPEFQRQLFELNKELGGSVNEY
jgi:hypothetical protein